VRNVFTAFSTLSLVTIGPGIALAIVRPALFDPYVGDISPLVALALVCLSGWTALYLLDQRGDFTLSRPALRARGALVAAALTVPFMGFVTAADVLIGFSREINVAPPASLVFYPLMGYVVELLFHAVPLAFLAPAVSRAFRSWSSERRIWLCVALVACVESAFQFANTPADGGLDWFVAGHLFLFGLVELYIFRRYDFISMYVFRIVYYAYWHVAWGYLRLQWLF
jgi:hypothetical protein